MEELYKKYNFPGQTKLYQLAKREGIQTTVKAVKEFIAKQKISQVFQQQPRKRGFIVAFHPQERVQMDLVDMTNYSKQNRGYGWILLIVDVFTRYVWAYMIQRKDVSSVEGALSLYIKKYHPWILMSDNESAFRSQIVQELMKEEHVEHTMVDVGDHKALGVIDRAVKTIKDAIFKYMHARNTTRYIDELPRMVKAYNETPNGGILNIAPAEADTKENTSALQIENYKKEKVNQKNRLVFHEGDHVRIRNKKGTFERSYDTKYGEQLVITDVQGKNVVLSNGETISKRRIVKVAPVQEAAASSQPEKVKRQAKIAKRVNKEHLEVESKEFETLPSAKTRAQDKKHLSSDGKSLSKADRYRYTNIDPAQILEGKRRR